MAPIGIFPCIPATEAIIATSSIPASPANRDSSFKVVYVTGVVPSSLTAPIKVLAGIIVLINSSRRIYIYRRNMKNSLRKTMVFSQL